MSKHIIISLALVTALIVIPFVARAAIFVQPKISFGGKVVATSIPGVECYGWGTGPIVLASNILSLGAAVTSATAGSNQSTATRTGNIASGIYGAIPYYAKTTLAIGVGSVFVSPTPKVGSWILGTANAIPNFTTCGIGEFPFPVKPTSSYKVSNSAPSF